ncbi:glycine zipper 2TM domain-containing protein [uncultured Sphingomonas sp.]|uniref:glycine zipper 2TM domain-containing protein n=1 Tax=uncultured Sphingomonas sp. TaxID=158754 RepID=UPI0035CBE975
MRNLILAMGAATMVATTSMALPYAPAEAKKSYRYREYRGRDGRTYCRRSNGTTGLVVGGVAGAVVGNSIAGRGDKLLGTVIGGAAGALGGRAIDRTATAEKRCR